MTIEKEDLRNKYFKILDYGFCGVIDWMGSDEDIETAARVSYGKGTRKVSDTKNLLKFLYRSSHFSPFEQAELKVHFSMPLFVARELFRHRAASANEFSGRFSEMPKLYYTPEKSRITKQSKTNKQGSSDEKINEKEIDAYLHHRENNVEDTFAIYETQLGEGVAREIARIDLPLSTYSYLYWKCDLRNIFNFLKLRCDNQAQWEIRQYANTIAGIVKVLFPISFEAWYDYSFCASNWTRLDKVLHKYIIERFSDVSIVNIFDYVKDEYYDEVKLYAESIGMSKRELEEFWGKLEIPEEKSFDLDLSSAKDATYFENLAKENG